MNLLVGTLIDYKPVTVYSQRNPSTPIIIRIESWPAKYRPMINVGVNMTEVADTLIITPLTADLRYDDRFTYLGRMYQILSLMPETLFGDTKQYSAVVRD